MGASEKRAAAFHGAASTAMSAPAGPRSEYVPPEQMVGIAALKADLVGYLNQCDCGQRTITREAHNPRGYRCPACTADAADCDYTACDISRAIETGHDIGVNTAAAAEMFPQHTKPTSPIVKKTKA